jgi:glycosyltransferase involved in cell wall biosynthesis
MLGHKRIPSREGGIEVVVTELASRMVNKGHSVVCYNRTGHHVSGNEYDTSKISSYNGIKIKYVPTLNVKGIAAVTSSLFASLYTALDSSEIVHFHAEGPAFFCFLPKLFGKKVIVTIHGLDHKRDKWNNWAQKYILKGEENAVKYADEIIVLSKNVRNYFKETYNRDTVYIPNGVEIKKRYSIDIIEKIYGIKKDEYILYLGRIVPEKGVDNLINVFKMINTDKKLVIAGGASDTGEYEKYIHNLAKDDDRIIFTGFIQGEKMMALYSNAYVYVLPSKLEGMPLSLMEAMSFGNCCLVSDIPECKEVVGDYGVTYKVNSNEDLKSKIQYLIKNSDVVREYKDKSTDYICKKYNWDDVVNRTINLYENLEGRD